MRSNGCADFNNQRCLKNRSRPHGFKLFKNKMAAGGAHRPHPRMGISPHIEGRFEEGQDIPWNYEAIVRRYLSPESRLLDIDTGGGEFLLSLNHPPENTSATEGYPPNVSLCQALLPPLGIDFREAGRSDCLPFDSGSFDLVINRHGRFDARELYRILKPGGCFVTQQVGAEKRPRTGRFAAPRHETGVPGAVPGKSSPVIYGGRI
mgnify:CR=1 FL=1